MAKKVEKTDMDAMIAEMEKKYGLQRVELEELTVVSTGSLQLNQAMGVGGTAVGKFIELFGPESCGKSTLTLHQMAEYQRAFPEKRVALFDYEHSFDMVYARALGVNVETLLIYQPETQEEGYDMIIALVGKDILSCVVVDSQSAAMPKAILQGEMGDATIGLQARNNSKFCMKIKGLLDVHNCTLFMVSQTRDKIGSMGGNAIKFYADIRWKIWKMNDKVNELNKTTVDVVKNKLASPFGQAKFAIDWGHGVDKLGEIIEYASDFDIIAKGGSWYTYKAFKCQGVDKLRDFLEENPDELLEVEKQVLETLKTK
jgi:recombination protein RecA